MVFICMTYTYNFIHNIHPLSKELTYYDSLYPEKKAFLTDNTLSKNWQFVNGNAKYKFSNAFIVECVRTDSLSHQKQFLNRFSFFPDTMASVEQREATHPAGLSTLELFDKFKVLDEDKDSDEESFHLPLLDSEEDVSSSISKFYYILYFVRNLRKCRFFYHR